MLQICLSPFAKQLSLSFSMLPLVGACDVLAEKNIPSRPPRLFHHHQQFSHSFLHVFNYSQITLCVPSKRRRSKIIVFIARYLSCIYRLVTEFDEGGSLEVNTPGCYPTVCVELGIDGLAVNAVLQV